MQLDQAARGFSFREAGPLDMRMDAGEEVTAEDIVNRWPEREMADLLYREADEHDSRRIARAIVRARPIRDTAHLATVVAGARKHWGRQRLHPATKTFLALRIAVNREMEELGQFLFGEPGFGNQRLPSTSFSFSTVRSVANPSSGISKPLIRVPVSNVGSGPSIFK